ncbi:MAG: respiratory chain complex I subunit 1 family protein [Nitrospiraceae bacterium]|nr:respiratory chain complex I subunit 1 family protein [Nitrospiraceae bacterium]
MEHLQFLIILLLSPLVQGVIKKLKALMQGRRGPGIMQPYFDLIRLFKKEMVISETASWIFRAAPYVVFSSVLCAAMIVPVISVNADGWVMGDVIALIYILGLGRFFMALAGLDTGTAFGGEGSSREMTVSIMVEPMMMLSIFAAAIAAGSTNLSRIAETHAIVYSPSHLLALSAFIIAVIAETGRIPVDNPDTHLELTMIHEGMLLEYSGRYLALMEWAHYAKQMLLFTIAIDIFLPFGITKTGAAADAAISAGLYAAKIAVFSVLMATVESSRAKLRFFQLSSLLGGAFVLSMLALLMYIMMGR